MNEEKHDKPWGLAIIDWFGEIVWDFFEGAFDILRWP